MKIRIPGARRATIVAICLVLALPALADVAVKKKTSSTPSGMGGAPQEQSSVTWIGDGKLAEVSGGRRTIVDTHAKKVTMVNDDDKSYTVIDLPIDLAKLVPGMEEVMEQYLTQMQMKIEVKPTDERADINGFPAQKTTLSVTSAMGFTAEMQIWMTQKIDVDMVQWRQMSRELGALAPPGVGDLFRKITELEGFPVLQETAFSMAGNTMTTRDEVVAVERGDAPAGTYTAPADYQLKAFDPMGMLAGQ